MRQTYEQQSVGRSDKPIPRPADKNVHMKIWPSLSLVLPDRFYLPSGCSWMLYMHDIVMGIYTDLVIAIDLL